ncbi:hypothetical protein SAMD00023353_7400150 [Rosellinia necatrix]|uniref:Uncharacterized protein n=1 Tax=Rosellinia necatrix TaxID=77044 RepID=A0A1S8AB31_ROSNE|nr:hypothetical protein SAMD00023353_7400150 [Rosellinia necatrix]
MAAPNQTALLPVGYHQYQYQSVDSEDLQSDLQSDLLTPRAFDAPAADSDKTLLPWRPFYLRRTVLLGFVVVFVLIVVGIASLLAVSSKNNGIATGTPTEHYLWTYGPTVFLTVVAAVWSRIEYQSKLAAPWIRLWRNRRSKHAVPASRTLLLDYISQFSVFTIVSSFRNRDFVVFIALVVSVFIKVLIVLSSGLISLRLTDVARDSYPMVLETEFIDDNTRLNTTGNLAWYVMTGLASHTLTLPEGISSEYAFQSVRTDLPKTVSETRVTTDGLRSSLQCDAVGLTLVAAQPLNRHYSINSLNVTVSSPGCKVTHLGLPGVAGEEGNSTLFGRFEQVQCDAVPGDDGKRLLVLFGNLTYYTDTSRNVSDRLGHSVHPLAGILNRSTQLLCVPTYAMDRIEVIHNGQQVKSVMPTQGGPGRRLESVAAWDIMEAQFAAVQVPFQFPQAFSHSTTVSVDNPVDVDADVSMQTALDSSFPPTSQAITLFEPAVLQHTAEVYYRQISAIITKQALMRPASETVSGSAIISENRLIIHPTVAQSMIGLLIACILFTTFAFFLVPTTGFLPHSPGTLLRSISLFLDSPDLLARLRCSGAADDDHLTQWLGSSTFVSGFTYDVSSCQPRFCINVATRDGEKREERGPAPQISSKTYHPIILHPASRATLCLCVVSLVVALELLLLKSNLEDGLGDISDDGNKYIRYTWTAVPALVFGALSIAYSTLDFQVRTLAPYIALKGYVSKDIFPQLEFLDMAIPVAMYKEYKLNKPWALATTTAVLFASLFTTLSVSLFQELSLPRETTILLQANQSFRVSGFGTVDSGPPYDSSAIYTSLILESNLSFPRFTFNDLAFPQFLPVSNLLESDANFNTSTVSISTVIPAVHGRMDCHSYESIHANVTLNYTTPSGHQNPLQALVEDYTFEFGTTSNATYFGQTQYIFWSYSDLLYLWGKIDYSATPIIQHIEALACNITFEAVDVNTTFIGGDLDIDVQNPPRRLDGSARNTTINNGEQTELRNLKADGYGKLANVDASPQLLDPFFAALVTSAWAVPPSALGDPSASAGVAAAIRQQHGLMQAQTLAQALAPANETDSTVARPSGSGGGPAAANDAEPRYNATATTTTAAAAAGRRRRVVQDAASTHALVALLAAALVLSVAGWAGSPGTDVLPRSPTTIASAAALAAGGNLLARLPPDAGGARSPEDVIAALGGERGRGGCGARFWMGWGNLPDEEGRLAGGENEAGVSQFGIFVVDEEEEQKWK